MRCTPLFPRRACPHKSWAMATGLPQKPPIGNDGPQTHVIVALCRRLSIGVTPMLVGPKQALVMEQEVSTLLRKEAIEVVPPLDKESGFYSRTSLFLFLTDPLSHTTEVQKALFKHVSHTRSEDCVTSDLEDAYSFPITGSS